MSRAELVRLRSPPRKRTGLRRPAKRSLLSAPGNGFKEARLAVLRRGNRAPKRPETQDLKNPRPKPLNRRAVWESVQETRRKHSAWWARQDSNLQPDRYQRQAPTFVSNGGGT